MDNVLHQLTMSDQFIFQVNQIGALDHQCLGSPEQIPLSPQMAADW